MDDLRLGMIAVISLAVIFDELACAVGECLQFLVNVCVRAKQPGEGGLGSLAAESAGGVAFGQSAMGGGDFIENG